MRERERRLITNRAVAWFTFEDGAHPKSPLVTLPREEIYLSPCEKPGA